MFPPRTMKHGNRVLFSPCIVSLGIIARMSVTVVFIRVCIFELENRFFARDLASKGISAKRGERISLSDPPFRLLTSKYVFLCSVLFRLFSSCIESNSLGMHLIPWSRFVSSN